MFPYFMLDNSKGMCYNKCNLEMKGANYMDYVSKFMEDNNLKSYQLFKLVGDFENYWFLIVVVSFLSKRIF